MHELPKCVRRLFCNKITRRFPCLPMTVRGCKQNEPTPDKPNLESFTPNDDDEDDLTPGNIFQYLFIYFLVFSVL